MNLGATKTRDDLTKLQFALPADEWIIQIVPEGNQGRPIRDIVTRQKLFSAEQVSWFRALNANGCHIYGRPNSTRYILIDDVKKEGIMRLKQDRLVSTAVIETSPDKFHVWIAVTNENLSEPVATQLAKLLEQRYSTDTGSADAYHLGRLPGLRNKKPKYQTYPGDGGPLVKLITARTNPVVPDAINELLDKALYLAEQRTPASSSAFGPCAPNDIDPSRSPMTETEAIEIYQAEMKCQVERKQLELPIRDRSNLDYYIANGLYLKHDYDPDDLAALLMYTSGKASDCGMDYVTRTVNAALK
jgi:hypothetical protein